MAKKRASARCLSIVCFTICSGLIGASPANSRGRQSQPIDVTDFGAHIDGLHDDTKALAAARNAAPANGVIEIPPGDLRFTPSPSGDAKPVLWTLDGTTANGHAPLIGLGDDLVENVLDGGRWLTRAGTTSTSPPMLRLDDNVTHSGGWGVQPALQTNCMIHEAPAPLASNIWCGQNIVVSYATGPSNIVALSGTAVRPADALADRRGIRAETWSAYFENHDSTGAPSNLSGSMVGIENDIYANGADPSGHRILLQMMVAAVDPHGAPVQVGEGLLIGRNDLAATMTTPIKIQIPFSNAAIDLSGATAIDQAPAIKLADGQKICLHGDDDCLRSNGEGGVQTASITIGVQTTPSTSSAPCNTGRVAWDSQYVYVCVGKNSWKRAALQAW